MEKLLRMKGAKAIVVVIALHMALGFNLTSVVFAQQPSEVLGRAQAGIIPDGGDVQANHEAMQALVNGQNQTLEDIEQFQTKMLPKEPANPFSRPEFGDVSKRGKPKFWGIPPRDPKGNLSLRVQGEAEASAVKPGPGRDPKPGFHITEIIGAMLSPLTISKSRPEFGDVPKRGKPKFDGKPMPLGTPIFEGYVQGEKEASAVKPGFYGIGMATGNRPWIGMTDKEIERAVQRWLERQKKGDWRLPMRPR